MLSLEIKVTCACGIYRRVQVENESVAKLRFREHGWRMDPASGSWKCEACQARGGKR